MLTVLALLYLTSFSSAENCLLPANFPSQLTVGHVIPINTQTAFNSPDGTLGTRISGSIKIVSTCSFQFVNLQLAGAPQTAQIKLYGNGVAGQSFPVSPDLLFGDYAGVDGPIITLSGTSVFQVLNAPPGVSFADFDSIVIFASTAQWAISSITLPTVLGSPAAAAGVSPSSVATVQPGASPSTPGSAAPKTAKAANSALGLASQTFVCALVFVVFAVCL